MNVSEKAREACYQDLLDDPNADVAELAKIHKLSSDLVVTMAKRVERHRKNFPTGNPTVAMLRQDERNDEDLAKKLTLAGLNTTQIREITLLTANRCIHLKEDVVGEARSRYQHDKDSVNRLDFVMRNRVRVECSGFPYLVLAAMFANAYRVHCNCEHPVLEEVAAAYKVVELQFSALFSKLFAKESTVLPFTLSDAYQIASDMHIRDRAINEEAETTVVRCGKCGCDYVLFTKIPGKKGCPICKLIELTELTSNDNAQGNDVRHQ